MSSLAAQTVITPTRQEQPCASDPLPATPRDGRRVGHARQRVDGKAGPGELPVTPDHLRDAAAEKADQQRLKHRAARQQ